MSEDSVFKESRENESKVFKDSELIYAAFSRCPCGAGLAYIVKPNSDQRWWDCSDILTGRAIPKGEPGFKTHTDRLPFAFWEVKSEQQPSAQGSTTRPKPFSHENTPPGFQPCTREAGHEGPCALHPTRNLS